MKTTTATNVIDALASSCSSKLELERRIARLGLGLVRLLENGDVSIAQAERDLFHLDAYNAARRRRLGRSLLEFLEWGMELDDVGALAPEGMAESFSRMTTLAQRILKPRSPRNDRRVSSPPL